MEVTGKLMIIIFTMATSFGRRLRLRDLIQDGQRNGERWLNYLFEILPLETVKIYCFHTFAVLTFMPDILGLQGMPSLVMETIRSLLLNR